MLDISGGLSIYIPMKTPDFILYYAYYGGGEGCGGNIPKYTSLPAQHSDHHMSPLAKHNIFH